MAHSGCDRRLDEIARRGEIPVVIPGRIALVRRSHTRSGEMDDGRDLMVGDEPLEERLIAAIADEQRNAGGPAEAAPGREIIDDDDALAHIDELVHEMTADVACAADNQCAHIAATPKASADNREEAANRHAGWSVGRTDPSCLPSDIQNLHTASSAIDANDDGFVRCLCRNCFEAGALVYANRTGPSCHRDDGPGHWRPAICQAERITALAGC